MAMQEDRAMQILTLAMGLEKNVGGMILEKEISQVLLHWFYWRNSILYFCIGGKND